MGICTEEILQLYALASELPAVQFAGQALALLRRHHAFDMAFWCNVRSDVGLGEFVPTAIHLVGLDDAFFDVWAREVEIDPALTLTYAHPGEALRLDIDATYAQLEGARRILRQSRLRCFSCCLTQGFAPGDIQFVSLYRKALRYCDHAEKESFETLLPHLRLAWKLNLALNEVPATPRGENDDVWCVAARESGVIIRSQAAFREAIAADFGVDERAGVLPRPLRPEGGGAAGHCEVTQGHVYRVHCMGGHVFAAATSHRGASRLTARQYETARHYATGLSHKQVAARLGVAPSTVRNLLAGAFERLGVGSRHQLARCLTHGEPRDRQMG
ncbi:MAG: helix-turn-helix transcriptional regulator [Paucibacter sp.]|nr:helix-turn-helix transcriptional regulator [Roseateles sp.]